MLLTRLSNYKTDTRLDGSIVIQFHNWRLPDWSVYLDSTDMSVTVLSAYCIGRRGKESNLAGLAYLESRLVKRLRIIHCCTSQLIQIPIRTIQSHHVTPCCIGRRFVSFVGGKRSCDPCCSAANTIRRFGSFVEPSVSGSLLVAGYSVTLNPNRQPAYIVERWLIRFQSARLLFLTGGFPEYG